MKKENLKKLIELLIEYNQLILINSYNNDELNVESLFNPDVDLDNVMNIMESVTETDEDLDKSDPDSEISNSFKLNDFNTLNQKFDEMISLVSNDESVIDSIIESIKNTDKKLLIRKRNEGYNLLKF